MKILLLLCVLISAMTAQAQPDMPMTVKERLRILLWTEGLKDSPAPKRLLREEPRLPEELEKPLRTF